MKKRVKKEIEKAFEYLKRVHKKLDSVRKKYKKKELEELVQEEDV